MVAPHGRASPRLPELAVRRRPGAPPPRPARPGAVHVAVRDHVFRVTAGVFWQVHVGAAEALLDAVLDGRRTPPRRARGRPLCRGRAVLGPPGRGGRARRVGAGRRA